MVNERKSYLLKYSDSKSIKAQEDSDCLNLLSDKDFVQSLVKLSSLYVQNIFK